MSSFDQTIGGRSGGGSQTRPASDSTAGGFSEVTLDVRVDVHMVDICADIVV